MKLKEYLKETGISRKDFAERIGVTHRALMNYIYGLNNPKQATRIKIAKVTKNKVIYK